MQWTLWRWSNIHPYISTRERTIYMIYNHDNNVTVIQIHSALYWPICNVLPQFSVSGINSSLLCNNVLIHRCWLLLLLLANYCQRIKLVTFWFLPHSTVVYHSTNQCCDNEWNSTGDDCWNSNTGGTRATEASCIGRRQVMLMFINFNEFLHIRCGIFHIAWHYIHKLEVALHVIYIVIQYTWKAV